MMSSLQKTVEQQNQTIQQLAEIVAKSESRYRSLEKIIRWMGVTIIVLVVALVIPIKRDMINLVQAQTPSSGSSGSCSNLTCDQAKQMAQQMMMQFKEMVGKELGELSTGFKTAVEKQLSLSDGFKTAMEKRINFQITVLKNEKSNTEDKEEKQQIDYRIQELGKMKEVGPKMTLMDHIAAIDYDFDNLTDIAAEATKMAHLINKIEIALDLMPGMAYDMHQMNVSAGIMTAAGAPAMGRMSRATSWMPWW